MKGRLRRLERAIPAPDVAHLADGSRVVLAPGERFGALMAVLDDEHHPLHDLLPRLAEDADPSLRGFAALIAAFGDDEGDDDEGDGEGA